MFIQEECYEKIYINYDLLDKINESENGYKLSRYYKYGFLGNIIGLSIATPFIIYKLKTPKCYIPTLGATFIISSIANYALSKMCCNSTKDVAKSNADLELRFFCSCLCDLEVKTNIELLKESQVIQKDYGLIFSDNKPKITENKYIKVQLANGYDEIILQEHILGTKDYEISVKKTTKELKYKLAKAS